MFLVSPLFRIVMRIISITVWLLTVASAFGGRCNPDFFTLPAILCLALPYLTLLSLLLILYWVFAGRYIFTALGVAAMGVCLPSIKEAVPFAFPKPAPEGATTFKIISWNVLHTDDIRCPDYPSNRAVEYMVASGADIICLSELDSFKPDELKRTTPQLLDSLKKTYPYSAGQEWSNIRILSKYPVTRTFKTDFRTTHTDRFDFYTVKFPSHTLTVGVVHLYSYDLSEEERQVMKELKSVDRTKHGVREFKGTILAKMRTAFRRRAENAGELRETITGINGPLIVCGDFNDVPASWTYNLIRSDDMRDAFTGTNIGPRNTYNLHGFYFHIDQMLYKGPLEALDLTVDRKIDSSDHYPLVASFAFTNDEAHNRK